MAGAVSVIVPVYNVEKYLERCLGSLVQQTLDGIEIIVVNDGSPDNSQAIIDEFAAQFPGKLIALRQENQGVGPARNYGMQHATGEYIGFMDSDDWAKQDMLERLYETAKRENADVVICGFFIVKENDGKAEMIGVHDGCKGNPRNISEYVLGSYHIPAAWNKLYRRELAQRFPYPNHYGEDAATTPVILSHCEKIAYLQEPLIYYYRHSEQLTAEVDRSKILDAVRMWERCLTECNPKYRQEMELVVYSSLNTNCQSYKRKYGELDDVFMAFITKYGERFLSNEEILAAIAQGKLPVIEL